MARAEGADEEHRRTKAFVAEVQAGLDASLEGGTVQQGEVAVDPPEIGVDELGHQGAVWEVSVWRIWFDRCLIVCGS